ncbi:MULTISPECIES: PsiF family protein [Aeromonas]
MGYSSWLINGEKMKRCNKQASTNSLNQREMVC